MNDEKLQKALRLTSISASTLSRRLRKVDHRVWEQTFTAVKKTTWQHTNLHQTLPQRNTLLDLLRAVQTKLYDAFADLLAVLSRIPARTSRGRRPNSFSADYAQLLKEIKEYGTDFLDATGEDMYL